jgi:hypothetical protein
MIEWPIIDCLPTIKLLFISSSYVLYFEWFKMIWELKLEIIFEVQRKRKRSRVEWPMRENI